MTLLQLPNDWVSRLSRYSIGTKAKIRGYHKGSHRSQRFGSSLDFSDFREYHPGDDVRHVDWNVYARTDRVYIKRFLDEQEMRVHIMVDSSKSMKEKWLFTKQLAFSLGLIVLTNDDRLTVSADQSEKTAFRRKGKSARKLFEHFISQLEEPSLTEFAGRAGFHAAKDSTVLFILSDGLDELSEWQQFFRHAPKFSRDVRFIHISSEQERSPDFEGDVRFVDDETGDEVNVTVTKSAADAYEEKRLQHGQALQALCRKHGVHYLPVHMEDGIQHAIFHQMARQNWIH